MRSVAFGMFAAVLASQAVAAPISGSVSGQAFLQTSSGTPQTCAGQDDVLLLADDASADQVKSQLASSERAFVSVNDFTLARVQAPSTPCDAAGTFEFTGVAPGTYFLVSRITWAGNQQGGYLMRRIEVAAGQAVKTILSARVEDAPKAPPVAERDSREIAIERAVKARLIDPSSAEFEWSGRWIENTDWKTWRWSKPVRGDVTCGRVNARNRMGGYVGQTTFLAVVASGSVAQLQMDSAGSSGISISHTLCEKAGFY
jgi:hypothetical protein